MRPKRDPVPRAKDSWVWLGGLALLGILGGGVTAAAVLLWENVDIRQLVPQLAAPALPVPAPELPRAAARDERAFEAVVFSSPRNQAYFPDPAYYRAELDAWSELVESTGGTVRRVADTEGLRGLRPQDLLVLVEAPCLSVQEVAAVQAHLDAGGGVVSNWAVGVRDADCEWTGWQTILDITGAEDVREIPPREGLFLTIPAAVSLSPGFDPGMRIELRPDPSLALRMQGPRVYWSDWALNPRPDESGGGADVAAIASHSARGGRISWFGLRLGQAATPADNERLVRLVQNGISWAASVPTAAPAAWPGASRAALAFTLDVEDQPQNALHMAAFLRDRDLPGTFFVVSRLVMEDQAMGQALLEAGEVGSQTSDHTPLQGLTAQDQRVRLRRSSTEIESWTGVAPVGLRPPEETFDPNTLDAWQRAGGTYLVAANESRSASPEIHRVGEGTQVLLPRLIKDDYNIIVQDRVLRGVSLGQALLEGTRKMRAIGGLAIVAGHTQIIREGPRIAALAAVADTARAQGDWWIARASDIATWWTTRSETTLAFESPTEGSGQGVTGVSEVVVTAPPDRAVEELWVDIVIPSAPDGLIPLVGGRSVAFQRTEWGMRIPVGSLPAGETRRITYLVLPDEGVADQDASAARGG